MMDRETYSGRYIGRDVVFQISLLSSDGELCVV